MLSFASDFWPLFWMAIGIGAAATVVLCILVSASEPDWAERVDQATVHQLPRSKANDRKAA
jgi:hypothetical protein